MPESINENATIRDLAVAICSTRTMGEKSIPHTIVPNGYSVADLEKMLSTPVRIRAKPTLVQPESFNRYVKDFKNTHSRIFAYEGQSSLCAHLDHPAKDEPTWSEHKACLLLQSTPEWDAWMGIHRKAIKQVVFAEFIEEHTAEIICPAGATMLEVALTLQDNRTATVKSAVRMDNGTIQFRWEEEANAKAGKDGGAEIPQQFTIAISPFKGMAPFKLNVLLRYRVSKEDGVSFTCVIKDHEKAKEQCFRDVLALVAGETGIIPLLS